MAGKSEAMIHDTAHAAVINTQTAKSVRPNQLPTNQPTNCQLPELARRLKDGPSVRIKTTANLKRSAPHTHNRPLAHSHSALA